MIEKVVGDEAGSMLGWSTDANDVSDDRLQRERWGNERRDLYAETEAVRWIRCGS